MYNQYIKTVFSTVMGRDFKYDSDDDVNVMHSIVFLCQIKGAPIGHYVFKQTSNGPKSAELADDLVYMREKDKVERNAYVFDFSKHAWDVIYEVKNIADAYKDFELINCKHLWIECVATLIYWREFVYTAKESQALLQIMRRSFMYVDILRNLKAYVKLEELLAKDL